MNHATKTIANETIEAFSAADYNVKKHSIMKEAKTTTLGLATLKKMKASIKLDSMMLGESLDEGTITEDSEYEGAETNNSEEHLDANEDNVKDASKDQDGEDNTAQPTKKCTHTAVYDQANHWFSNQHRTNSSFGDDTFHAAMLEFGSSGVWYDECKQLKWLPKGGRTRKDASVGTIYRCTNYQQLGCQFQVTVVKDKDCHTITVGNLPHNHDVSKREKTGKGLAKEV